MYLFCNSTIKKQHDRSTRRGLLCREADCASFPERSWRCDCVTTARSHRSESTSWLPRDQRFAEARNPEESGESALTPPSAVKGVVLTSVKVCAMSAHATGGGQVDMSRSMPAQDQASGVARCRAEVGFMACQQCHGRREKELGGRGE